jgi:hypothetical protein
MAYTGSTNYRKSLQKRRAVSGMARFSRRSVVLGAASLAAAGAGVTAAASGLSGSVEGQADVEAEQALTVNEVKVGGDDDARFTRTSDDNTEFQAAVELNNGDEVTFEADIENSSEAALDVQVAVDSPDVIDVTVRNGNEGPSNGDDIDDNTDDENADDAAVKTGEGTFISSIAANSSEDISIDAELDDTASPSSYDIGVAINPLSTDN